MTEVGHNVSFDCKSIICSERLVVRDGMVLLSHRPSNTDAVVAAIDDFAGRLRSVGHRVVNQTLACCTKQTVIEFDSNEVPDGTEVIMLYPCDAKVCYEEKDGFYTNEFRHVEPDQRLGTPAGIE